MVHIKLDNGYMLLNEKGFPMKQTNFKKLLQLIVQMRYLNDDFNYIIINIRSGIVYQITIEQSYSGNKTILKQLFNNLKLVDECIIKYMM